ncbi:hypothetical protein Patl1_29024 [Pistacia atlantica]|uniref:Uncharacterized protein n=1 Tax=Pistacia atlantica TaxID=434234 RepID=A0ACC1BH27_9ROSI|nr:hypothetical protein Patl1_29024 [Pistacia atlantica]
MRDGFKGKENAMGSNLVEKNQFDMLNDSLTLHIEGEETGSGPYEIEVGIGGSSEDINGRAKVEDKRNQGGIVSQNVGVEETKRVGKVIVNLRVSNKKCEGLKDCEVTNFRRKESLGGVSPLKGKGRGKKTFPMLVGCTRKPSEKYGEDSRWRSKCLDMDRMYLDANLDD